MRTAFMKPLALSVLFSSLCFAQYVPADVGQQPAGGGVRILPEQFLRGFDPVTVYFPTDQVGERRPTPTTARSGSS